MPEFAIGARDFTLDGEPFRILSGALHYFRVHPDLWADRIRKAKQMGLNTIETYVPWNAHARRPGEFDFGGRLDLGRFLDLIAAEGLYAIVRPGPFICAEWDNGGLPAWLFQDASVGVRRDEPRYLAAVTGYFEQIAPVIAPRQIDRGGCVILIQIENEYGAYGSDAVYLQKLVDLNRAVGFTVPFTTVDQPNGDMLAHGSLPSLHKTGSFGSRSRERLATLRANQPTGPLMCSEFWVGWFDHWGGHHHTTSVEQAAAELEELLAAGASVNIYMVHGGTNFGFTNGANDKGVYQPTVTSYDYDAPLDEAGNPTAKYWAFREVLARYNPVMPSEAPAVALPSPVFTVPFTATLALADAVELPAEWQPGQWQRYEQLPTMDAVERYDGFALYRTAIAVEGAAVLSFDEVRDRALVSLDGVPLGVLARDHGDRSIVLPENATGTLELLVEDQGRVNYGQRIGEPKGLIGEARVNGVPLKGWHVLGLELDDIRPLSAALIEADAAADAGADAGGTRMLGGPVFARASFDGVAGADGGVQPDLFLDTRSWGKGVAWVNGFCLGRYWSRGPQRTLYVPGPLLKAHGNELIVFETLAGRAEAAFVSALDLGHTEF